MWVITKKIHLVRHTQTVANREGIVSGRKDSPLTKLGESQLIDTVDRLASHKVKKVYTSPSARARVIADLYAKNYGAEVIVDERIHEIDFGVNDGIYYRDLPKRDSTAELRYEMPIAKNGESRKDLDNRVRDFLESLESEAEDIAVTTHGGPLRSIYHQLLGLRRQDSFTLDVSNGIIVSLGLISDSWMLHEISVPKIEL